MLVSTDRKIRCFGETIGKEFYAVYHDNEWGVPVHDDQNLFEIGHSRRSASGP